MWPDLLLTPGSLALESDVLLTALGSPAASFEQITALKNQICSFSGQ